MNKSAIKNFAVWARETLMSEIRLKANGLGIHGDNVAEKLDSSTKDVHFFDIGTGTVVELSGDTLAHRNQLAKHIVEKAKQSDYPTAYESVMEEVAYTWFNRLVAIRFMEVNDYLPSKIRVLSSETVGKQEPDLVTTPFDAEFDWTESEKAEVRQLQNDGGQDPLFRYLFRKQCAELNKILPKLFEPTTKYMDLLLNFSYISQDSVIHRLVHDIPEEDFREAVEIVGWMFQFYNTEPKAVVDAKTKKGGKVSKEEIPAKTQLFTPSWIVKYMVENSLGRIVIDTWINGAWQNSEKEKAKCLKEKWKYYIDQAPQTDEVQQYLTFCDSHVGCKGDSNPFTTPTFLDSCMGSGHILVYAFDIFMDIYRIQGYTDRDATQKIMLHNLYGLDIDKRAYQLSYFALMMKARSYDRRFLTRGISPNVFCPSQDLDLQNFGSLYQVTELPPEPQEEDFEPLDLLTYTLEERQQDWQYKWVLDQKYDVVCTNPPYMGTSMANETLSKFVKEEFPDSKADLFATFIERDGELAKPNGLIAMVTMHAFMFLSSYEKLREKLLEKDIITMAHLGARAFEEISGEAVQTAAFVLKNEKISGYTSTYDRLVDYNSQDEKEKEFLTGNHRHTAQQENFSKIPSSPIAYWVSEKMLGRFNDQIISDISKPRAGLATGDNPFFQKLWYEVDILNIGFGILDISETKVAQFKWYPCNSGGDFRKWSTNDEYVVNWKNDGFDIRNFKNAKGKQGSRPQNTQFYFKKGLTWNKLSSSRFAVKFKQIGYIYDDTSRSAFVEVEENLFYVIGLLCSIVAFEYLKALNPTMSFTNGDIERIPYKLDERHKPQIDQLVQQNISLSKTDWDSFETSWDFEKHPLLSGNSLTSAFETWETDCQTRFDSLKSNEEELNRLFIEIYGLQEELTPEVEEKDVTVRLADLQRDIKSLISYAVGCIFGRYSLDSKGLAFAGGDWDESKYEKFQPVKNNCVIITEENFFPDDLGNLVVKFLETVYGSDTLEENLKFIAMALGSKGGDPMDTLRSYLVKDFYKDHLKIYQKRPIYWLYDAGKKHGFKALVYMHRFDEKTTATVCNLYLEDVQRGYEEALKDLQIAQEVTTSSKDIAKLEKKREVINKKMVELKDYYSKIDHMGRQRITIDLDDGVKVNYEKVQVDKNGVKYEILSKI
ncbi:MAG: BREX-1 system adenine-specific DNA-methyltransferase PglX [Eubacteriales bacterium]